MLIRALGWGAAPFLLTFQVHCQQPLPIKNYQDRREYELALRMRKERDAALLLVLARQWGDQYPHSAFSQERFSYIITSQQTLGRGSDMLRTAEQMRADDPKGLGNYWITLLTIALHDTSPSALRGGELAAQELLRNLKETYSPGNKPTAVSMQIWSKEKERSAMLAHRTLGWVALRRKQWTTAEQEFTTVLQNNPKDAESSFWLGTSILSRRRPETQVVAIYHCARALAVAGPGALTPRAKTQVKLFLERAYIQLHGNRDGLARLIKQARSQAFPPSSY